MQNQQSSWARPLLMLAGFYNIGWGAIVVFFPALLFDRLGLEPPRYPAIWQCVGMIVGVYGIGYIIASRDPSRHWPIVLVGLLGKVLGPLGFIYAALITHELPGSFGWVLIPNDLIWWIPFGMILYAAAKENQFPRDARYESLLTIPGAIERASDQYGISVLDRSVQQPVMLVFLRHMGCAFCLQTLEDLQRDLPALKERGIEPVVVHMSDDEEARRVLLRYSLEMIPRVSDKSQSLYRAFELSRGGFLQLFGPRNWIEGLRATLRGNLVSGLKGDGFQMPGVFVIKDGRVIHSHRHRWAGERIRYTAVPCRVPTQRMKVQAHEPRR